MTSEFNPSRIEAAPLENDADILLNAANPNLLPYEEVRASREMIQAALSPDQYAMPFQVAPAPERPRQLVAEDLNPQVIGIALSRFRSMKTSATPEGDVNFDDLYEKPNAQQPYQQPNKRSDYDLAA